MKFIVFGLGNFGAAVAHNLVQLGHEVIGIDNQMAMADKYKHSITHTIAMDSTNREAIKQLPLDGLDAAIVGMGEDEGATILTTALLKQLDVKRIICRVTSPVQKIVLEAMNITEFVYPESSSAERLALKLDLPGVIDSFRIHPDYRILEVAVPERYVGRSIEELNFNKYNLVLVTIIKPIVQKNVFGGDRNDLKVMGIVQPETILKHKDILLLFGTPADLESFIESR
jgi:trk system potassium uptake protein